MTPRYQIVTGPDGIFWVPIQPLLQDINDQLNQPDLPDHMLFPLEAVRTFISALNHEGTMKQLNK